ncbi:MAG: hypothetical protein ACRBFS_26295 [Aureispira sp.]
MLKFIYLTLLFYGSSTALWAQLPSNFPLYADITAYIINHATCHAEVGNTTKINVIKNNQGFWVAISRYQENSQWDQGSKQLVWSPKEGFVEQIYLEGEQEETAIELQHFKKQPLSVKMALFDEYNVNRFLGEENWAEEVINYYQQNHYNTAEDSYSLGRAHSYKSAQYLLKYGKHHLLNTEPKLLEALLYNSKQAIAYFKTTHELAPDFKTVVGSIYTKYCNEIVALNSSLASLGLKEQAQAIIANQELYSDITIAFSKNSLESCPLNAILFTNGDNDTYPLLYLQQAKQIRTDVLIINESLLNLDYYIDHLSDRNFYSKSYLECGLAPNAYQGDNNSYILVEQDFEKDAWSVQQLLQLLEADGNELRTASTYGFILGEYNKEAITLICSNDYLSRSALLLLTILEKNYKKRAILFAPSYAYSTRNFATAIGIKRYLHIQGINHQFYYEEIVNATLTKENTLNNYQLFIEQLQWPVLQSIPAENRPAINVNMLTFKRLFQGLIAHKELKKVAELKSIWYASFSNIFDDFDTYQQIRFIEQLEVLEEQDKSKNCIKRFMKRLLEDEFLLTEQSMIKNYLLPKLKNLVTKYDTEALRNQLQQVEKHYEQIPSFQNN